MSDSFQPTIKRLTNDRVIEGKDVNLGDSALTASDYVFRVGTAKKMRYFADHDINGCKWFITGLWCPPN